jgi:guanidinopropionase
MKRTNMTGRRLRACASSIWKSSAGATYVSFDIDCIDPSQAPGTGTPEIGGFTTREAQEMIRLLQGVDIVGADVVEVAPPFDLAGMTAIAGATMMFELLCVMAAGKARS